MRMIQSSMLLVFVLLSFVSFSWSLGKMFTITHEREEVLITPHNPVSAPPPVVLRIECKEAQDLGHLYPQGMYCVKFDESGITLSFTFEDCKSEPTTPPSTLVMIRCGEQAGGALCPDDLCCSSGGYCGRTLDHCGEGCQSQCKKIPPLPQAEIRCGVQAKGASCPDGLCCSKDGYCGVNPIHCGDGCQDQCDPSREEYTCGEKDGVKTVCPDGLCCSQFGTCGVTPAYCGQGCQSQCLPKIPPPSYKPRCGVQAGGALCPDGLCCSKWGYCGLTSTYCYDGCQSQCKKILPLVKPRLEIRCGVQAGGALCPDGLCCSKNGYCGVNSAHCGEGCQAQCDPSRKEYTCGEKDGVKTICPDGLCCSQFGTCGVTPAYCGQGCQNQCFPKMPPPLFKPKCGVQAGGALCPDGLCCSKWGHCGSTPAYCSEGCQSQCTIIEKPLPPSEIRCGRQGGGALCSDGLCCSLFGYCGITNAHCCEGCQSQCYGEGSDTSRAYCRENDIDIECITNCKVQLPPRVITF